MKTKIQIEKTGGKMDISFLDKYGWCTKCTEWIKLPPGHNSLPKHKDKQNKICEKSGYSPWKTKYKIKTITDAKRLAKIIKKDSSVCLNGKNEHSMSCNDGEMCSAVRRLLAKALADFVLEN
ncbi:MAG TPA: hypothetical protein VJ900_00370 [Patescibacteria group bacterium]|nr:hypothetical protein [Patescibacteria group bacterium]